ncbi:mid region of cactin-domain-containing protein [Mucidula mucida]|nr:mid region of cactin-domain-containing protein [Mucidula mucida]
MTRSPSPQRIHDDRDKDRDRDRSHCEKSSRKDEYDDRDRHKRRRSRSRDRDRDDEHRRQERSDSRERRKRSCSRKRDKSEERKARKAEKKRIKEEEEARQVAELSVYSATDNPFHDVNLGQQFRWHKKNEKERKTGMSMADSQRRDAIRRQEAKEELERLNRRRAEREADQRIREEEELRMQRLQESAQMSEWLAKEGDFRLEQERNRAAIRIREKRAKAIDFLALNLKYVNPPQDKDEDDNQDDAGLEIDLDEPYNIFDSYAEILSELTSEQVEELHDDIERYLTLEQEEVNIDFWSHMMVVCKDNLDKLKANRQMGMEAAAAVEGDIARLLSGKTYDGLVSLQRQVQAKLTSGEPIDNDYWETLLKKLLVWKAKAKLKSFHEVVVRNRLEQLRKRQRDEALQAQEELLAGVAEVASAKAWIPKDPDSAAQALESKDEDVEEWDPSMEPPLLDITKLPVEERQVDILTAKEDLRSLLEKRRAVAASRFVPKVVQQTVEVPDEEAPSNTDLASEALYRAEAERELEEEEELFNMEEDIVNPTTYNWEDKYRPRKPRYFNRVHTGYEWNKYNQTHYDTDNPPPKVVQGYKFNIFYPDLIDKSKAPTYKIVKEPGNEDTVLLHFTAGPPYEDIAFRIVNKEWEFSHKRGFRSSFDRGCLSLWFNYRRNVSDLVLLLATVLSLLSSIANNFVLYYLY